MFLFFHSLFLLSSTVELAVFYSLTTMPLYTFHLPATVTIVKGELKASFSIATTPRCRERCYSFPWITPLYP